MEQYWLFVLETDHIPGVAANIATAFSRRGIQIDGICAEGVVGAGGGGTALVSVTFSAFAQRMEILRRKLERLEVVRTVKVWNCDADAGLWRQVREHIGGRQASLAALMAAYPPDKTTVKPG